MISIIAAPYNPLSLRERAGERGSNAVNGLNPYPLILAFSRREKGCAVCIWGSRIQLD